MKLYTVKDICDDAKKPAPFASRILEEITLFEKYYGAKILSIQLTGIQERDIKHRLKIVVAEHGSKKNKLQRDDEKVESVVREYIEQKYKTQISNIYTFHKDAGGWFIDLPEYLDMGGSKGDLAMVAGADTMLDSIAQETNQVTILMDTAPFKHADELELLQLREPGIGGGDYILRRFEGKEINQVMWLCDVTRYVFGYLPERIYIRRVTSS